MFDGPKRPLLKRNKTRGAGSGYGNDERRTKTLVKLLGFEVHQALGEAEAECALLQKRGVVDAVWSEDVDTLMFGSGLTLKGWSSESAGNGPPTHVSIYDAKETKRASGLDPEGMILVALMSGGDYDTDGIPRCGAKIACEAARAGFGRKLCALDANDEEGLAEWRRELAHELWTNESKFFRQKSKAIVIPDDFPKKDIFRYYTNPAVSSEADVKILRQKLVWDRPVDISGLREYVEDVFQWTGRTGAKKMIQGLAPSMLVYQLRERYNRRRSGHNDLTLTAANEQDFVREITGERAHFSTDGTLELRVTYQPSSMVPWDLDAEIDTGNKKDENADEDENNDENRSDPGSPSKNRSRSPVKRNLEVYDPVQLERVWVPRSIVMVGVPLKVQDYEDEKMLKEMRVASPKKARAKPVAKKPARAKGGMQPGALDKFLKVGKPMQPLPQKDNSSPSRAPRKDGGAQLPPVLLAPEEGPSASKEPAKQQGRASAPPYEDPPLLQKKIEREGFIAKDKPATPNVRPRREYRKAPAQPARTNQTTLSAFKITKSSKQQNSSQKSDLPPLRHQSNPVVIEDDDDPFYTSNSHSYSKKHPRNLTPPSPIHDQSSAPRPPSRSLPAPAKKRAPLQCSKTIVADSSEGDELSQLKTLFKPRTAFRKSISDPTATIGSSSVLEPKEKREIIDLLSSPLPVPRFSSPAMELESPRRESLVQLTDDDSFHTARESLPLPHNEIIHYDLPDDDNTPISKQRNSRASNPFSFEATTGKQKRFMAPRESLPGAWKEYTEEEVAAEEKRGRNRSRFQRKSGIEVLDLTRDTP